MASDGVVRLLDVEPTETERYAHALEILRRAEAAEARLAEAEEEAP